MGWRSRTKVAIDWRDRPCWRCGYSLRNLPGGDVRNCPECGLAIRISLSHNPSLTMANPQWLGRQALACVLAATAAMSAGGMVLSVVLLGPRHAMNWTMAIVLVLLVLTSLTELAAWWLLAARDPNQLRDRGSMSGRVSRVLVCAAMILLVALGVYAILRRPHYAVLILLILGWPSLSALIAAILSNLTLDLMRRSQHRLLRRVFRGLVTLFSVAILSPILVGYVAAQLFPSVSAETLRWGVGVGAAVGAASISATWLAAAWRVWADRRAAIANWVSD